jgi:hypothetical protein
MPKIQNRKSSFHPATSKKVTNSEIYQGPLLNAALLPVGAKNVIANIDEGYFLLNPSTWEDSKSSNWIQNIMPGQSDPVLQWQNGGARTVSFEALVTRDTSDQYQRVTNTSSSTTKKNVLQQAVASIASSFYNVPTVAPRTVNISPTFTSLDISNYLDYYRSLLYPMYDNASQPARLLKSPPLVTLWVGNSISYTPQGDPAKTTIKIGTSDTVWAVTNIGIRITKQLANLAPMEAVVSFQLVQYTQIPIDNSRFL